MQKIFGNKKALFMLLATIFLITIVQSATVLTYVKQSPSYDQVTTAAEDIEVTQSSVENEPIISKTSSQKVCKDIGEFCTLSEECCSKRCLTYAAQCVT